MFPGIAFGAPVASGGDLVVNTSQTGYQEIATDPSYAGQVVVMTYPLIGNYGRLHDDDQSARPWLRGLVVAHATAAVLDDARQLATLLRTNDIPAIAGVDTRALARHLRSSGSLRGIITEPGATDHAAAVEPRPGRRALGGPGLRRPGLAGRGPRGRRRPDGAAGRDRRLRAQGEHRPLARAGAACASASCPTPRPRPTCSPRTSRASCSRPGPATPPGSTGPSRSPARSSTTAGRCWASASGTRSSGAPPAPRHAGSGSATTARTTRSRTSTPGYVQVTAQNHEVQVVGDSLPASSGFRVSQVNLNDRSVEGLRHAELPIETVQYHPEGAPGPLDALAVFDRFVEALRPPRDDGRDAAPGAPGRPAEAGVGPHPRLGPGRHRAGRGVRLRRDAGLPRAARRGRAHDPRQLATRPRS